jgi:exosortase E/protease (VPEID-CTERM system)
MLDDSEYAGSTFVLPRAAMSNRPSNPFLAGIFGRMMILSVLLSVELLVISILVNIDFLSKRGGLISVLPWGHIWRAAVGFVVLVITFGFLTARSALQRVFTELPQVPVNWGLLTGHFLAITAFGATLAILANPAFAIGPANFIIAIWIGTGILAIFLATAAFVPLRFGLELLRNTRGLWALGMIGAVVAVRIDDLRHLPGKPLISVTVRLVRILLSPFVSDLKVDPATGNLMSHRFHVIVTSECSGLEGAGMMLVFTVAWLYFFRKECRFPRVLFLVPLCIVVTWLLNSVRLAGLFLIGYAGAPGIAMGGFHSQAGWIAFCTIAFAFTLVLNRAPVLMKSGAPLPKPTARKIDTTTTYYLVPFLTILAASMVTHAASDGFEWLYPLRFVAAASVLWYFRREYGRLDWRISWAAPLVGCVAFAMWLGLDAAAAHGTVVGSSAMGVRLASLVPAARKVWIIVRTLAASVTVPIAEELAFRGFLLRRLISQNFEAVSPRDMTWLAILVSSVAFGILHGNRWFAGTFAGVLYALAFRHRGRMGDAVAAHAITNAMLAGWVLLTGNWGLW